MDTDVPNDDAMLANTIDNKGGGTVNIGGYSISSGMPTNVDNRIQGAGGFSNITVNNQSAGVINANTSGQTLAIVGTTVNNSGILEATNGGTLQIGGGHGSGGGGGHGHGKHSDDSGDSGDNEHQGRQNGFLELKHMIDEYYGNTVTAAAAAMTGTAAADSAGNTAAQGSK